MSSGIKLSRFGLAGACHRHRGHSQPVVDVVIPVHNEQAEVEHSVRRLNTHLARTFPYGYRITIADNASTDATALIAARLAAELGPVEFVLLGR